MPAALSGAADRPPPRPRYLIPLGLPRRRELLAALATAALLGQLALAPVTLVIAVALWAAGRISRWHASWLAVPAAAGTAWTVTAGLARAAAGYTAVPSQLAVPLIALLTGHGPAPYQALAAAGHALPGQLPLALLAGTAEAGWLRWLDWLHRAGGYQLPRRPGAIALARRRHATAAIRGGGVVTRDGCCLGVEELTGRRVTISWKQAETGVLCAGTDPADAAGLALGLAVAAIRRRKSVIIIDVAGGPPLAGSLARACEAASAPLTCYGDISGQTAAGCYEPARWRAPGLAAELVLAMADWPGSTAGQRATAAACLHSALAVLAARPADPRQPLLDELIAHLQPGQLPGDASTAAGDAAAAGAGGHPAGTAGSAAGVPLLAAQLAGLRGSALGQWLRPARSPASQRVTPAEPGRASRQRAGEQLVSLPATLLERGVVLFSLDQRVHRRSAAMVARLAAADFVISLAEYGQLAARCDCLLWVNGCEVLGQQLAASLLSRGRAAGAVVLLSTAQPAAMTGLTGQAGVLIARRRELSALTGAGSGPASGSGPTAGGSTLTAIPGTAAFLPLNGASRGGMAVRGERPEPAALLVRSPSGCLAPPGWLPPAGQLAGRDGER